MSSSSSSSHQIVVGIDLGTTYSAAAWAPVSDPTRIELIRNWPTSGQLVGNKVPTEIAYSIEESSEIAISWGYDISPRSRKIKWFKLGLETEDEDLLSLPSGRTVVDVARDYLAALHHHVMTTLGRRLGPRVLDSASFHFVLTVPAIWSDAAKKKTELAAVQAGFTAGTSTLELLSEPESAAIFALKTIENVLSHVQVGDRMVVCDAGGGTVDLISYDLLQTEPILSVKECAAGIGDFCGSSFIDREFEKLFAARLGSAYDTVSLINRQQVLKNFELSKMAFRGDANHEAFYINVPAFSDLPSARLVGGSFELTRDEMCALFDPVVDQVIDLLVQQVNSASTGSNRVNAVLLVGGFGESEYLYTRVQQWAAPLDIDVLQPRDASTAVVQGAVMLGTERRDKPEIQVTRRARRSYGVPTKEVFRSDVHLECDAELDFATGQKLATHQVRWFIRANQTVGDEDIFRHRFRRSFTHLTLWEDSLVSSTLSSPPTRLEASVHKHCIITSDLTHVNVKHFRRERRGLKRYYVAEYELVISLRNNNLTVSLEYDGKRYGVADIQFETTTAEDSLRPL